jgi:hypothetical protein
VISLVLETKLNSSGRTFKIDRAYPKALAFFLSFWDSQGDAAAGLKYSHRGKLKNGDNWPVHFGQSRAHEDSDISSHSL